MNHNPDKSSKDVPGKANQETSKAPAGEQHRDGAHKRAESQPQKVLHARVGAAKDAKSTK